MVQITFAGRVHHGKQYVELAGLSTDGAKRTAGYLGGSLFWELDTKTIYALDEENEQWIPQVVLSEPEESQASLSAAPTLQLGGQMQPAVQQPVPTLGEFLTGTDQGDFLTGDEPEEEPEEEEQPAEEPEEAEEEPEQEGGEEE